MFVKFSRVKAKPFPQFSIYLFIFEDEIMYFLKTWNKKCAYLVDCLLLVVLLLLLLLVFARYIRFITFRHIFDNNELTKMDSGGK